MQLSKTQYNLMTQEVSPKSKSYITIPSAFLIGGAICALGEALITWYSAMGLSKLNSSSMASITLILISAVLTGFKLYEKIAKRAGAGTLVPITGFANAVVAPAIEFKSEGLILGLGAKIFIISGPVILYGTLASVLYGIIYYLFIK